MLLTNYWVNIILSIQYILQDRPMEINQPHIVLWDEMGIPPSLPVESSSEITIEVPVGMSFGEDPGQVMIIGAADSLPGEI
jgi:hypothetical protein